MENEKTIRCCVGLLVAKIRVDGPRMGGTIGQIAAILMALTEKAQHVCSVYLQILLTDPAATTGQALAYLDRVYNDPQEQQRASDALMRLRQGTDNFETFYAEFERLIALAGGSQWPESIKMQYLCASTHSTIVGHNLAADDAQTLDELARRYRKISDGMAMMQGPRVVYATQHNAPLTHAAIVQPGPYSNMDGTVPMDIDVNNVTTATHRGQRGRGRGFRGAISGSGRTRVNPDGGPGPGLPTDASLRGKRAMPISREVWESRKVANACLRCGRHNCYVAVCPLAAFLCKIRHQLYE